MTSFPAQTVVCTQFAKKKMAINLWSYLKLTSVKSFSEEQENVNTKKKTLYDLNLFRDRSFLQTKVEMRELQEIPAPELQHDSR